METKSPKPESHYLFSTFVMGLASAAMMELGMLPDPETKATRTRPEFAKQNIDLLEMFRLKTLGNLSSEEQQLLDKVLVDLKLQFVKVSNNKK